MTLICQYKSCKNHNNDGILTSLQNLQTPSLACTCYVVYLQHHNYTTLTASAGPPLKPLLHRAPGNKQGCSANWFLWHGHLRDQKRHSLIGWNSVTNGKESVWVIISKCVPKEVCYSLNVEILIFINNALCTNLSICVSQKNLNFKILS